MTDREQLIEHEKRVSPLSGREIEEADERSSTTAKVVHEAIRLEGTEELERPSRSIAWSGLAAGMTMGCSMIAQGLLQSRLPDAPWRELVTKSWLLYRLPVRNHGPATALHGNHADGDASCAA